ncbi:MAG: hypothetical protein KAU17_05920 [Spirochaetales bacterium]|nr:hypothetical protein [Spirochaetales bacterium]
MKIKVLLLLIVLSFLFSCTTTSLEMRIPEGFALLEKNNAGFSAISPEGIRLEIRKESNEPFKDIDFWEKAYLNHMEQSGYEKFSEPEYFTAEPGDGFFIEWAVPYQGETYIYLNAVLLKEKEIIILEAAGPLEIFSEYREGIIAVLETIY